MPRQPGWPSVNPGRFRNRIVLMEPVTTVDASGVSTGFAAKDPPCYIMADIEYMRGTEQIKSGQDVTQSIMEVTSWYHANFTPDKQIMAPSGAVYIIQNVNNLREMGVYMVLTCLSIGPQT